MKKRIFATLLALCSLGAIAQDNMTQSATGLVQSININPAARPSKGFVSIPVIGSLQVGVNSPISYSNVISTRADGKYINIPSLISAAAANGNSLLVNFNMDIVNVGFYVTPDDFINITVNAKVHGATNLPLGLFEFVSDNTLSQSRQYNVNFTPNVMSWAEIGVGYSRSIGNFTVGARLKYVAGIASLSSPNGVNFLIDKDYDKYLLSADYSVNTGGVMIDNAGINFSKLGLIHNPGFAVDLGATWLSDDERISASVSVSDLGKIWWNGKSSSELRVRNPNVKFEYDGLGNLLNQGLDFGQLMDSVVREFNQTVGIDTVQGVGFATALPTRFQAMGAYSLGKDLQHNISLGFIGSLPYRGTFDYAISVGYGYRSPNKMWQLMANYTYMRNRPYNLGVGVVFNGGPFQLYLAVDDVIAPFNLSNARGVGARLGLNFFFGPESVRN